MTDKYDDRAMGVTNTVMAYLADFADEDKSYENVIYQNLRRQIATALRQSAEEARAEERERCATVCENMGHTGGRIRPAHKHVAQAIRGDKQ